MPYGCMLSSRCDLRYHQILTNPETAINASCISGRYRFLGQYWTLLHERTKSSIKKWVAFYKQINQLVCQIGYQLIRYLSISFLCSQVELVMEIITVQKLPEATKNS